MKINMLHLQHHTGVIAVSPAPFASAPSGGRGCCAAAADGDVQDQARNPVVVKR